ncbi:MAG TPA: GspE/PulE family protein [Anaerolineales bacterium]|nr:GspE/PulE family protein [Anaerolineales bacterium]
MTTPLSPRIAQDGHTLGHALLEAKLVTAAELRTALEKQKAGDQRRLGRILLEEGVLDEDGLAMALSVHLNLPFIDLKRHTVQAEALRLVPEELARRHSLIPLDFIDGSLALVMEDPTDIQVMQEISALTGKTLYPTIGVGPDIRSAIDLYYRANREIEDEVAQFAATPETAVGLGEAVPEAVAQDPIVRAVDLLLEQAVRDRASDIHLEPDRDAVQVRFRVDGVLHRALTLPKISHGALLSRIKVLAGMNIAERRRAQDGQFSVDVGGEETSFRVATSETTWGEMAVLRILGRSESILDLSNLGLRDESLAAFRRMIHSPYGMVLVSGPTGSGKTTTLYAAVNQLDRARLNVMTIEDPVEYNFPAIHQIQVNRAAEITFASGLRGIMRMDPDVILVGEVRDGETAEAAVQAALTGHLVLSSIHANEAAGALYRLAHLGIERYLIVSAVIGVVAQRLVRRVCTRCAQMAQPAPEEKEAYLAEMGEPLVSIQVGEGCAYCNHTGFQGRTGVFEVMALTPSLRRLLIDGAGVAEVESEAVREGMITMRRDAMMKVKTGVTTPGEVMRNVYTLG